jgi:hypothetical protein
MAMLLCFGIPTHLCSGIGVENSFGQCACLARPSQFLTPRELREEPRIHLQQGGTISCCIASGKQAIVCLRWTCKKPDMFVEDIHERDKQNVACLASLSAIIPHCISTTLGHPKPVPLQYWAMPNGSVLPRWDDHHLSSLINGIFGKSHEIFGSYWGEVPCVTSSLPASSEPRAPLQK